MKRGISFLLALLLVLSLAACSKEEHPADREQETAAEQEQTVAAKTCEGYALKLEGSFAGNGKTLSVYNGALVGAEDGIRQFYRAEARLVLVLPQRC